MVRHILSSLRLQLIFSNPLRHFPKARVWPPVAPTSAVYVQREQEAAVRERSARARLPSREIQDHLLELYFAHVHPFLPVIHKDSFMEAYKRM